MDLRENGTELIDLKARTLIPGFIDAHTHLDLVGMAASDLMVKCYCPPLQNVEEMLEEIRKRVDLTPKGERIFAHRRFDQPHPTKEQLDSIAPEHPVIMKDSMHDYTLNSYALREFRITRDYPTQEELFEIEPGAIIERDPETNEPTGRLFEAWNFLFPYSFSPYPYEETKRFIKIGLDRFSSAGVTSVTEFADFPQTMRAYQDLLEDEDLNVRMQVVTCVHGLHKTTELDAVIRQGLSTGFGNDFLRFMGIKIFVDRGHVTTLASIQLDHMVLKAHRNGLRVYIHAINRAAQDMALRALEAAEQAVPGKNYRHRIEHMGNEFHDPSFLDRIKKMGVIPLPTAYFMRIGSQPWLKAKTTKAFPFKSLLEMGLCVPGNSDSAGTEPEAYNPLYNIWCMVARKSKEDEPVSPEEKISVMDAIKVYTMHSAYAGFDENVKGSIEPGKMADFAVLPENPLTVPEDDLKDMPVDITILNGRIVYQR
jgi:predicted amidohydrolase YtcJ